jgi:hypothetical protein
MLARESEQDPVAALSRLRETKWGCSVPTGWFEGIAIQTVGRQSPVEAFRMIPEMLASVLQSAPFRELADTALSEAWMLHSQLKVDEQGRYCAGILREMERRDPIGTLDFMSRFDWRPEFYDVALDCYRRWSAIHPADAVQTFLARADRNDVPYAEQAMEMFAMHSHTPFLNEEAALSWTREFCRIGLGEEMPAELRPSVIRGLSELVRGSSYVRKGMLDPSPSAEGVPDAWSRLLAAVDGSVSPESDLTALFADEDEVLQVLFPTLKR